MISFEQDYISVTITDSILKVAHLRGSPQAFRLMGVFKKEIKDTAEDDWGNIIRTALDGFNVRKAKAICVMPCGATTTKNIEIPSIDPQEIKSIIDLQAGRHTPFAREEIIVGYINIGVHERNYTKTLLIIINRQIIKKQLAAMEQAGLKVEKVVFAPEGKAAFYGELPSLKESETPYGIIDIGKYATDFIIAFKTTVVTCRNIPMGLDQIIKEGTAAQDKLITEVATSLEAYQNEDIHKMPATFILTSDDAKVKELPAILQEKLKASIKIVPYLDHIAASQEVMLKIVSEFDDESFLDAISGVAKSNSMQVDLTPEEVKVQHAIEDKARQVVQVGIKVIALLLLVCLIFFAKIYFHNQYLARLTAEYESKRKVVEELEEISTNTKIVKDYLHSRMLSLDVINELYSKIPEEIYLKNLTLDEDGTIRLQGISESRSTAFAFVTVLEDSFLFKKAKMISSSAQKDRGKDVSAFEISFRLESAPDEEEPEVVEEEAATPVAQETKGK